MFENTETYFFMQLSDSKLLILTFSYEMLLSDEDANNNQGGIVFSAFKHHEKYNFCMAMIVW